MKDWAVILGVSSFNIINNKHITEANIKQVVRMSLTSEKAIKLATQLNKTLDGMGH